MSETDSDYDIQVLVGPPIIDRRIVREIYNIIVSQRNPEFIGDQRAMLNDLLNRVTTKGTIEINEFTAKIENIRGSEIDTESGPFLAQEIINFIVGPNKEDQVESYMARKKWCRWCGSWMPYINLDWDEDEPWLDREENPRLLHRTTCYKEIKGGIME